MGSQNRQVKKLSCYVDPSVHSELTTIAANQNISVYRLLANIAEDFVVADRKRRKKSPTR